MLTVLQDTFKYLNKPIGEEELKLKLSGHGWHMLWRRLDLEVLLAISSQFQVYQVSTVQMTCHLNNVFWKLRW